MTGFEPATTRPPDVYSNRTELRPDYPLLVVWDCKYSTLFLKQIFFGKKIFPKGEKKIGILGPFSDRIFAYPDKMLSFSYLRAFGPGRGVGRSERGIRTIIYSRMPGQEKRCGSLLNSARNSQYSRRLFRLPHFCRFLGSFGRIRSGAIPPRFPLFYKNDYISFTSIRNFFNTDTTVGEKCLDIAVLY